MYFSVAVTLLIAAKAVGGMDAIDSSSSSNVLDFDGTTYFCNGIPINEANFPIVQDVEADIVYYNGLAYEPHPKDPELASLIDKAMDQEELSEAEVRALETVRMPEHDVDDMEEYEIQMALLRSQGTE